MTSATTSIPISCSACWEKISQSSRSDVALVDHEPDLRAFRNPTGRSAPWRPPDRRGSAPGPGRTPSCPGRSGRRPACPRPSRESSGELLRCRAPSRSPAALPSFANRSLARLNIQPFGEVNGGTRTADRRSPPARPWPPGSGSSSRRSRPICSARTRDWASAIVAVGDRWRSPACLPASSSGSPVATKSAPVVHDSKTYGPAPIGAWKNGSSARLLPSSAAFGTTQMKRRLKRKGASGLASVISSVFGSTTLSPETSVAVPSA